MVTTRRSARRAAGEPGGGNAEHRVELPEGTRLPEGVHEIIARPSPRRHRTVSLKSESGRFVLLVPAGLTAQAEGELATGMLARLEARRAAHAAPAGDDGLMARALDLRRELLPEVPEPLDVRWVDNQQSRWGSCTSSQRTIRISRRVQQMPGWVLDYVLVHELAHLAHSDHGPGFQELLARCPRSERASGFLEGWATALGRSRQGTQ